MGSGGTHALLQPGKIGKYKNGYKNLKINLALSAYMTKPHG
jgi:hypothetical protein